MASAAQIEAFAWWLTQDREGRKSSSLAKQRSVPDSTAQKWVVQFNKQLAKVAGETITSELTQHPDEYRLAQGRTMTLIPKLLDGLESAATKAVENGKPADIKALREIASTLKTVYSLAEQASGADVAKRKALQPGSEPVAGQFRLPDLSGLFESASEAVGEVIEPAETIPINESGNENRSDSDTSEEI